LQQVAETIPGESVGGALRPFLVSKGVGAASSDPLPNLDYAAPLDGFMASYWL